MAAFKVDPATVNPRLFHPAANLQWVTGRHDECGGFAGLEASEPIAHPKDFGGVEGDGAEAFL